MEAPLYADVSVEDSALPAQVCGNHGEFIINYSVTTDTMEEWLNRMLCSYKQISSTVSAYL